VIPVQAAISRCRRDLTLGMILKAVLLGSALACFVLRGALGVAFIDAAALLVVGAIWLTLSYRSIRGSRLAAGSPSLIAAGHLEAAEHQIEQALSSFSLFRTAKLMSLHHLAVLRHAQKRWADAAELCRAVLRQRLGNLKGISRQSRLILADALLELGDLRGTQEAIARLYDQRLSLAEAMNLLAVQLDYESRVNAWERLFAGVSTKVQLAELMPTPTGARTQALLALAAKKVGRDDWAAWLRRRVELLVDVGELVASRPVLRELWPDTPATVNESTGEKAPDQRG
jgi:hypothetical protein